MSLWKMNFSVCFLLTLVFVSCTNSRHASQIAAANAAVKSETPVERIMFINLIIRHDSISGNNKVEFLNKTISEGHLKSSEGGTIRGGDFLTCILYEDSKSMDTVRLEHPLYRVYEYMNEKNEMKLKAHQKKEASFFLRYQWKGKQVQVKILETLQGRNEKEIALIQL
jgi:hypothetical protein